MCTDECAQIFWTDDFFDGRARSGSPVDVEMGAMFPDAIRCAPITGGMPVSHWLMLMMLKRGLVLSAVSMRVVGHCKTGRWSIQGSYRPILCRFRGGAKLDNRTAGAHGAHLLWSTFLGLPA